MLVRFWIGEAYPAYLCYAAVPGILELYEGFGGTSITLVEMDFPDPDTGVMTVSYLSGPGFNIPLTTVITFTPGTEPPG